jgi:SAM-dependent methyltransferase
MIAGSTHGSHYIQELWQDCKRTEEQAANFIDNVLRQVPSHKIFELIREIFRKNPNATDQEVYEQLLNKVDTVLPYALHLYQLKALYFQKNLLSGQAQTLLSDKTTINGCLEIGTPGTYTSALSKKVTIKGKQYAAMESPAFGDRFQAFSFNPMKGFLAYDQYVPLDYEPLSNKIPDSSVDVVICFIGLHHCPTEKLDAFIGSIQRVLRPDGVLLLRDHDIQNDTIMALAHAGHTVFNAIIPQVSVEAEVAEIRNFHTLDYWKELLRQHGFEIGDTELIQDGDPTINTMIAAKKRVQSKDDLATLLQADESYKRSWVKSHLSAPEWFTVDMAADYSNFINHTPFYEYPFLSSIATYWKVFFQSWKAAAAQVGHTEVLFNDSTFSNIVLGSSMTVEYAAKALLSLPVRLLNAGVEAENIGLLLYDPKDELQQLDPRIIINQQVDDKHKLVTIPRYKQLLEIMNKLAATDIIIEEIAGNTTTQIKVSYDSDNEIDFEAIQGCCKEYKWQFPAVPHTMYATLTIEVSQLNSILAQLHSKNISLLYIHDF